MYYSIEYISLVPLDKFKELKGHTIWCIRVITICVTSLVLNWNSLFCPHRTWQLLIEAKLVVNTGFTRFQFNFVFSQIYLSLVMHIDTFYGVLLTDFNIKKKIMTYFVVKMTKFWVAKFFNNNCSNKSFEAKFWVLSKITGYSLDYVYQILMLYVL